MIEIYFTRRQAVWHTHSLLRCTGHESSWRHQEGSPSSSHFHIAAIRSIFGRLRPKSLYRLWSASSLASLGFLAGTTGEIVVLKINCLPFSFNAHCMIIKLPNCSDNGICEDLKRTGVDWIIFSWFVQTWWKISQFKLGKEMLLSLEVIMVKMYRVPTCYIQTITKYIDKYSCRTDTSLSISH